MNNGLRPAAVTLIFFGTASACTALLGNDFEVVDETNVQGGSGGEAGAGGSGSCEPGTSSCADSTTLVECSSAGEPIESQCPAATPVCVGDGCRECEDSTTHCNGAVVEHCDGGTWAAGQSCDIGCDAGACLEVVDIGAGAAHTCAVLSNGSVRCWGYNKPDLLFLDGLDDPAEPGSYVTTPTPVEALDDAVQVSGGDAHSCVLTATDEIKCWGWNGAGQLGTGDFVNANSPATVTLSSNVVSLAVGMIHNCVALASGSVACWGLNEHGQFGNGEGGSNVFEVDPVEISLGTPATTVSSRYGHTCARVTPAEAGCWGYNLDGQLGNGTQTDSTTPVFVLGEGVQEIATGDGHTCGRDASTLVCFGRNNNGQLGLGTTGADVLTATIVTAVGAVTRIVLGGNMSCIVDGSDNLVCWGRNVEGQIGNGTSGFNVYQLTPFTVPIGAVQDVALGHSHSCALTTDGTVMCWGLNNHGQLGTGDIIAQSAPQAVVW